MSMPAIGRFQLMTDSLQPFQERLLIQAWDPLFERTVALKGALAAPGAPLAESIEREFLLLRQLRHPRLPIAHSLEFERLSQLPEPWQGRPFRFFVQPWFSGPSLRTAGLRSPLEVQHFLLEITEILAFFHRNALCRADITPDHFIRTELGWCWIDLELLTRLSHTPMETLGTSAYLAPGVLNGSAYSPAADIYSLGCVVWEAITGQLHWPPPGSWSEQGAWRLAHPHPRLSELPGMEAFGSHEDGLTLLLSRMLSPEPHTRPTAHELWTILQEQSSGTRSPGFESTPGALRPTLIGFDEVLVQAEHWRRTVVKSISTPLEAQGGVLTLVGPERSGRSRMLEALEELWQGQGLPVVRLSPRLFSDGSQTFFSRLWSALRLESIEPPKPPSIKSDNIAGDETELRSREEERLVEWLRQAVQAGQTQLGTHHHPLLLLLDDGQELDAFSQRFIARLQPVLLKAGLLLVTEEMRPWGAADLQHPRLDAASEVVEPIQQQFLPSLTLPDLLALWEDVRGERPASQELALQLLEATGGRAGACAQQLAQLQAEEAQLQLFSGSGLSFPLTQLRQLPLNVQQDALNLTLLERNLDEELLAVLLSEPDSVQARCRVKPLETLGWLLVSQSREGLLRWHWSSRQTLETLRTQLSSESRQLLGASLAELLESRALEQPEAVEPLSQLLLFMGETARARPYLKKAAELAQQALHLERAEQRLGQLLSTWTTLPSSLAEQQLKRAQLLYSQRQFGAALACAQTLTRERQLTQSLQGRTALIISRCQAALGKYSEALETLASVSPEVLSLPEQLMRLEILCWLDLRMVRLDQVPSYLEDGRRILEGLQRTAKDTQQLRRFELEQLRYRLWYATETLEAPGREAQAHDLLFQAEKALKSKKAPESEAQSLEVNRLNVMEVQSELLSRFGQAGAALRVCQETIAVCGHRLMVQEEANAHTSLSRFARDTGQRQLALEHLGQAARLYEALRQTEPLLRVRLSQADLLLEEGLTSEASLALLPVRAHLDTHRALFLQSWWQITYIRLNMRLGLEARWERLRSDEVPALLIESQRYFQEQKLWTLARLALTDRLEWLVRAFKQEPQSVRESTVVTLSRDVSMVDKVVSQHQDPHTRHRMHGLLRSLHAAVEQQLRAQLYLPAQGTWRESVLWESAENPSDTRGTKGLDLQLLSCVRAMEEGEEKLAAELARLVGEQFQGRGVIGVRGELGFEILKSHGIDPEHTRKVSQQVMRQVADKLEPLICLDVQQNSEISQVQTIRQSRASTVLCWPIVQHGECLGVLYVDRSTPMEGNVTQIRKQIEHVSRLATELLSTIRRRRVRDDQPAPTYAKLIGDSAAMRTLRRRLAEVIKAESDVVLLDGETGTGKTACAEILHEESSRSSKTMVRDDANLWESELMSSQLFGHRKGAFTGATQDQIGSIEVAHDSTWFLDEVGDIPLSLQGKLLRVIETKQFSRLGETHLRRSDFRLVAATHCDLARMVRENTFREDLYFRLRVNRIHLPSLRERGPEDIALLCLNEIRTLLPIRQDPSDLDLGPFLDGDAIDLLLFRYGWPGNVRELKHLFKSADIENRLKERQRITRAMLEKSLGEQHERRAPDLPPPGMNLDELKAWYKQLRQKYVSREIERDGGNVSETARRMGGASLRSQLIKIRDGKDQDGGG